MLYICVWFDHNASRSCRPNAILREVLVDGELHVMIVTTENIPAKEEVTIYTYMA